MFSVFVPCHDPDPDMLDGALASVTFQLDPARDQVVVLDDSSELSHVCLAAARRHGVGHVRLDEELGGVAAHNRCYALAEQPLVHLLHPDDWVLPGFYGRVAACAIARPDAALVAARTLTVRRGRACAPGRAGWLAHPKGFPPLHEGNPLSVPACVVRRDLVGAGWDARLPHLADWEFWLRLTVTHGAAALAAPLACWRDHEHGHSRRHARTGENLREFFVLADVVREYAPHLVDDQKLREHVALGARAQAARFAAEGDEAAAEENARLARELAS